MRSFLRPRSLPCLVNPTSPHLAEAQVRDLLPAARPLGLQVHVLEASTDRDFDAIFANLAQLRAGGLVVPLIHSSLVEANSSPRWQRVTQYLRSIPSASMLRPVV